MALLLLFLSCTGSARAQAITLIAEDDWYPYAAKRNGEPRGLAVDLVRAAYGAVNVTVNFRSAPYERCLQETKVGAALGCFDSLNDSKLAQDFLFHKVALFKAELGIYTLSTNPTRDVVVADLRGHRVGITHGYTYGSQFESTEGIGRETAPNDLSSLRKMLRGRSEYALVYTRIVDHLSSRYADELKGRIRQVGIVTSGQLFVSFSRQRPEAQHYADLLDQGLQAIQASGVYKQIEDAWKVPQ